LTEEHLDPPWPGGDGSRPSLDLRRESAQDGPRQASPGGRRPTLG